MLLKKQCLIVLLLFGLTLLSYSEVILPIRLIDGKLNGSTP